jgi:peptidoglycan hydrolase CwlO-like protein
VIILVATILCIDTCKAQDSINTPKRVLEYLYKQDVKVKYLTKDTANLKSEIALKDSLLDNCHKQVENKQSEVNVYKEQTNIQEIQITQLSNDNKKLNRKVTLWQFISGLVGLIGSVTTAYFIIR